MVSLTTGIVPIAIPILLGNRSDIIIEQQTLQSPQTTVNLSQMDAAPLGLQMFLVFGSSGGECQKLGLLAKAC